MVIETELLPALNATRSFRQSSASTSTGRPNRLPKGGTAPGAQPVSAESSSGVANRSFRVPWCARNPLSFLTRSAQKWPRPSILKNATPNASRLLEDGVILFGMVGLETGRSGRSVAGSRGPFDPFPSRGSPTAEAAGEEVLHLRVVPDRVPPVAVAAAVAFVGEDDETHVLAGLLERGDHLLGLADVDADVPGAMDDEQGPLDLVRPEE